MGCLPLWTRSCVARVSDGKPPEYPNSSGALATAGNLAFTGHIDAAIIRPPRDCGESGKPMTHARIAIDPAVMMGKPCIKGTRITVELFLRKLGAGRSIEDLLEAYPHLAADDVRAALAFAADYMQHETVLAAE